MNRVDCAQKMKENLLKEANSIENFIENPNTQKVLQYVSYL